MAQTLIVWLIIGCSVAYLTRHFYQAWKGIAQGKSGCGSCGNCPSGNVRTPLMPQSQVVGIDSLLTAGRKRSTPSSNDTSHSNM